MRYLYVDNYRGFKDSFIPLKDINFFVGENSTGKTSILSILKVICNPQFWYEPEFNIPETELGTFADMVSLGSSNKINFKIGMIVAGMSQNEPIAFLLTFCEREGLPVVYKYDYYYRGLEINIILSERKISYKTRPANIGKNEMSSLKGILMNWIVSPKSRKGFKELQIKHELSSKRPLYFVSDIVEMEIMKKTEKSRYFPFSISIRDILTNITWIAPVRTKPKRTYDEFTKDFTSEGSHTPYLIRRIFNSTTAKIFKKYISEFGQKSGLLDSISVKQYGGQELVSPFALIIRLGGRFVNIKNVGYGVSQILPVIVDLFTGMKNSWYAIQQPEIHLHPRAQAAIGDSIYNLAVRDNKKFLIETHSDYLIDRFRLNCRKKHTKFSSQVLFFKRTPNNNEVYPIQIDTDGNYAENQPKEFREFFLSEQLSMLGIK